MKPYLIPHYPLPAVDAPARFIFLRWETELMFLILLLSWFFGPSWLRLIDQTAGSVDQSIWLLIILSLIVFLLLAFMVWWLLQRSWARLKLPSFHIIVSQFNTLNVCQQLSFYWASYALLLLAALGCLIALC